MTERLRWDREGLGWPNREASRFVEAAGLNWHVQEMGKGPLLLLVHGTGATTHSWAAILPLLSAHFRVVAMDLPGHGFTDKPAARRLSMPGMAKDLAALLDALELKPQMVVGHSAGAAILMRMCLDGLAHPKLLVSLNGALLPLSGMAGQFFSPMAKAMARSTLSAHFFSWSATRDRRSVTRLIDGTGSKLPRQDIEWYEMLARNPGHVWAAINMMANWELGPLERDMTRLETPLVLIAAGEDRSISPETAFRVKEKIPAAEVEYVTGLGHLAHEEDPQAMAELFLRLARSHGIAA
ncbi:alpha/beta fold hydrolase BchO [Afifella pfennigii]|uniref:alpha/beta fold hydrolase BchO n=1 Tax=Afifella pfennigii TaxID=209897 RepID=UPI00047D6BC0|nr:alpha/beta fold hydrolase BchO [Afifella pfennigii]